MEASRIRAAFLDSVSNTDFEFKRVVSKHKEQAGSYCTSTDHIIEASLMVELLGHTEEDNLGHSHTVDCPSFGCCHTFHTC